MIQSFNKIEKISGSLTLPGDKSISHRALIFSALANGESEITNLPQSDDVKSTISCLKQLGVQIKEDTDTIKVYGKGFKGFEKPDKPLHAGNSGTTARILSGILAAQNFDSILTGDDSLSKRPMRRIIKPLGLMGARVTGSVANTLPLKFYTVDQINSITFELPFPSAQVKSSILLAGLHSDKITKVIEYNQTRDHSERMLGLDVEKHQMNTITSVSKNNYPVSQKYFVPGDISTSAFFVLLSLFTKTTNLTIKNVSLNPTRTGLLHLFREMGANINIDETGASNNEPYGDITVFTSELKNIKISKEVIASIIDEIPVLTIAGIFAEGDFEIRNAKELRVKESDRISALCYNLSLLGLNVEEFDDGFKVSGEIIRRKPVFKSFGDHRIAMAFGILSCLLDEGGKVDGFESVSVSNPGFIDQLKSIES
ncbi:MAG: 3-phosphoshikimate 1-carboxyvinyltransferase [Ignavibacteriae bacterium]|nr:MAG: 3-phosphoshikimate 1-carboxyvinyltransferase [Ignavibacteriota bacterium]